MSFAEPLHILLHLAAFSFLVSLAISGFMISAGLMDKPVDRSNHQEQVPTAGGVGIVAGLGAGLLALSLFYPIFANQGLLGSVCALALGSAFLGLLDDVYDIGASLKFVVMIVIAMAAVTVIGAPTALPFSLIEIGLPDAAGLAGASLWIFVVMNGVNFMDGSNGLMGVFMLVAFIFLALIATMFNATSTALFAAIMAAAVAGFLPYNWRRKAHIFSGDVGALTVGFCFAACTLLLVSETGNNSLLYVGPILILPYLADIFVTLIFRAKRKENLMAAHSSHMYQRLIRAGHSHVNVAIYYGLAAIISGGFVLFGLKAGIIRSLYYLMMLSCVWVMVYLLLHRKYPSESGQPQKTPDP